MNHKEKLISAAAKYFSLVGGEYRWDYFRSNQRFPAKPDREVVKYKHNDSINDVDYWFPWEPDSDNDAAIALAVALKMKIDFDSATVSRNGETKSILIPVRNGKYLQAIVDCAAES